MLIVNVKGGNIEGALKVYKNKVKNTHQIESLRERKEYKKPSVARRLILEEAKRKNKNNY
jgi:ribosomal protein S21